MGCFGGLSSPAARFVRIHAGDFEDGRERTCMESRPFQPPVLVTLAQAAELLSVSLRTVQRMVKAGRIEVVYVTPDTPRVRYGDLTSLVAFERGSAS
jgi:excisionase family DNA binding protein